MKKTIVVFLLSILGFLAKGQTGHYFLSNYTPSDERIDYLTFGMAQDDKGVVYFANKSNVLQFDGRNWTPIPTPGPVYTIALSGKDVFVGGLQGYGKIVWGKDNVQVYESLSQTQPTARQIISSFASAGKIYFLSQHGLYVVTAATGVTDYMVKAPAQDVFSGVYELDGNVYVASESHGLLKLNGNKLDQTRFALPENSPIVFCSTLYGTRRALIGTGSNKIYLHENGAGIREVRIKDAAYLESNVVVSGVWVNESLVAIGTLRGGVIFINPVSGATEEVVNYYAGLPDNEVYAILSDHNQGVWVAHDYGYTRIAPYLPFRSFSHYRGLSGNLLCARNFNNQIYVGTTLGLFNLVREEVYADETFDVQGNAKATRGGITKSLGGIFSIFKRDKSKKKTAPAKSTVGSTKKSTRKVLKSLQYVFKKVDGVDGKVSQLTEAHGKLLASGITGVLEVSGLTSKPVTTAPVRSVFLSKSLDQLLVSTIDEEVRTFRAGPKGWEETHLLDTLRDDVNYIFEDKLQNVWLCGRSNVFKIETIDKEVSDINNIPFSNPSLDEPVGVAYGSEVYVAASGEINKFDFRTGKFASFHSLSGSKKYFASAGYFWFYDGHYWLTVDKVIQNDLKLKWLGLFQNIRFLAPAGQEEGLWVITASNELYKFSTNKLQTESGKYPLFLREVRGEQTKIAPAPIVKVNQLETTVSFDFIQPNYFGMRAIEYHYKVNGLSKTWTDYSSTNNIVPFSYLPIGTYKVEVQTRDLMGNESDVQQIQMEVIPPYWKRSWFYATEVAFFGLLVFLSMRLGNANSKYRYLSDLLSLLTIIMLIQFIQTIASSQISIKSTPVFEFFIQVFIALLVLPLENYLRKFMNRPSTR